MHMIRRAVMFALLAMFLLASSACDSSVPSDEHYFDNFKTVVAKGPSEGWTPYWLGRSFEAAGVSFTGPSVADFGDEVDGGGVIMSYRADRPAVTFSFHISLFSSFAWADALKHGLGGVAAGATQTTAQIAGATATVTSGPDSREGVRIDVDLGNTHVLARVGPTFAGSTDINTLNDRDVFVAVLQHLRPYPQ